MQIAVVKRRRYAGGYIMTKTYDSFRKSSLGKLVIFKEKFRKKFLVTFSSYLLTQNDVMR